MWNWYIIWKTSDRRTKTTTRLKSCNYKKQIIEAQKTYENIYFIIKLKDEALSLFSIENTILKYYTSKILLNLKQTESYAIYMKRAIIKPCFFIITKLTMLD